MEGVYVAIVLIVVFAIIVFKEFRKDYINNISEFVEAKKSLDRLFDVRNGYLNNYRIVQWQERSSNIINLATHNKIFHSFLPKEIINSIKHIVIFIRKAREMVNSYNSNFIRQELITYQALFANIEGRALDIQQRVSIIKDEDNNLVVAGAGSGKTTTIVGKVKYIIDRYRVPAEDILLISFTKKSSESLARRINVSGIKANTFHKFGLDVITEVEQAKPALFDESNFKNIIKGFFDTNLKDPNYLKLVVDYFMDYNSIFKSSDEFNDFGESCQYMSDNGFITYKPETIQSKGKATYNNINVKSIEECKIANYLFFNRVEYFYEKPYQYNTSTTEHRQYIPDFTIVKDPSSINNDGEITDINSILYLEHFGIDKNHNVPKFFANDNESYADAKKRYNDKIKWARKLHKSKKTKLIETYSYEFKDNTIFKKLELKLIANGIILDPMSHKEIYDIIYARQSKMVESFIDLLATFIVLMKSNNLSFDEVKNKALNDKKNKLYTRTLLFLDILSPLYNSYIKHLTVNNLIDFSDMINKATNYIAKGSYNHKIQYIIIDEYQDISFGRYKLLAALRKSNPAIKLFCVGDDWQSIYRFTGSDIGLFKNFGNYYGVSEISKIETTYRFSNPLLDMSSEFILKNPNQTPKHLNCFNQNMITEYKVLSAQSVLIGIKDAFDDIIEHIPHYESKEVVLLGRYNNDFKFLDKSSVDFSFNSTSIGYKNKNGKVIKAEFLTVHSAKGLEADIVIIINCKSGEYGFPSQIMDDNVLNLLLSSADQYENGEERRLFYVAMSRAKEMLYLIAPNTNRSKFINELLKNTEKEDDSNKYCPKCKSTLLVNYKGTKNYRNYDFWACPNFKYGCDYKRERL